MASGEADGAFPRPDGAGPCTGKASAVASGEGAADLATVTDREGDGAKGGTPTGGGGSEDVVAAGEGDGTETGATTGGGGKTDAAAAEGDGTETGATMGGGGMEDVAATGEGDEAETGATESAAVAEAGEMARADERRTPRGRDRKSVV